jgi:hypothetical protein
MLMQMNVSETALMPNIGVGDNAGAVRDSTSSAAKLAVSETPHRLYSVKVSETVHNAESNYDF